VESGKKKFLIMPWGSTGIEKNRSRDMQKSTLGAPLEVTRDLISRHKFKEISDVESILGSLIIKIVGNFNIRMHDFKK
jgi:hypothetical protein